MLHQKKSSFIQSISHYGHHTEKIKNANTAGEEFCIYMRWTYHFLQIHSYSQSKKQRNKMVQAHLSKSKQFVGGELGVYTSLHLLPVPLMGLTQAAIEVFAKQT